MALSAPNSGLHGSPQSHSVTKLDVRKPILERKVLVGKESLLYSGGWQPGEKVDSCPISNSEDSAPP